MGGEVVPGPYTALPVTLANGRAPSEACKRPAPAHGAVTHIAPSNTPEGKLGLVELHHSPNGAVGPKIHSCTRHSSRSALAAKKSAADKDYHTPTSTRPASPIPHWRTPLRSEGIAGADIECCLQHIETEEA